MGALALAASMLLSGAPASAPIAADLADRLAQAAPSEPVAIIVRLDERADVQARAGRARRRELIEALQDLAARTQAGPRAFLESRGARAESLWIVNALTVQAPAGLVPELALVPGVGSLRLDARWALPAQASAASGPSPEWNIAATGAPQLWALGLRGQGAVVAILDTGVDIAHADLKDRLRAGSGSWFDAFGQHASPVDPIGHGTQVAGIAVGGDAGGTAIGMAPSAQLIAAKVFDDSGVASVSAIHRAMQWAMDPDGDPATDDAPDVVNNSWDLGETGGTCDREFEPDIEALAAAGIAVVFAAGNTGAQANTSTSPANYPQSLSVGAIDRTGQLASFSARGPSACDGEPFPDLVAPGAGLRTSDRTSQGAQPLAYALVSGTSFASPHVAGAVALLSSMQPKPDQGRIREALLASGAQALMPDDLEGHGPLDVSAAYARLVESQPDASAPAEDASSGTGGSGQPEGADAGTAATRARGCGCENVVGLLAGLSVLAAVAAARGRRRRAG